MEYYVENLEHQTVSINAKNLNYLPHLHQDTEIVTVLEGELLVMINGEQYVLQAGDCAFIQPYSIHSYTSSSSQSVLTIFNASLVPALRTELCKTKYASNAWRQTDEAYLSAIKQLLVLNLQRDSVPLIKGYLYVACSLLLSNLSSDNSVRHSLDSFQQILQYVNGHYEMPLTIQNIAHKFGISYEHLSRVYRENTGLTFSQHVRLLRIDRAKRLLRETDLPINAVMNDCGYTSEKTFYRVFRETVGLAPRQYRIKHLKTNS